MLWEYFFKLELVEFCLTSQNVATERSIFTWKNIFRKHWYFSNIIKDKISEYSLAAGFFKYVWDFSWTPGIKGLRRHPSKFNS